MSDKKHAEFVIKEYLDEERLKRIIRNTAIVSWNNKISEDKIEKWLNNFDGSFFNSIENERRLALWLLAHFSYYTMDDIRILCKQLFNQFIHDKLCSYRADDIPNTINEIINNTLFVGLGNPSESGNNILYYFRQENNLGKQSFEFSADVTYENIVYIDDVTISGEQAQEYITNSQKVKANNIYVAIMIATEEAINNIEKSKKIDKTIATIILDKRDRAFSNEAFVFSEKKINSIREIARDFCEFYGKRAVEMDSYMICYPLGYNNGQYMIGFEHNTPDNTLPIFWGEGERWQPLFKRYQKKYQREEYTLDVRKYY